MAANAKREGRFITLKIFEEERDLLQKLGQGPDDESDRYTTLAALALLVAGLDLPDIRKQKRRALRVQIPPALDEAIEQKAKATGQPWVTVLLAAAEKFRQDHPGPDC